MSAGAKRVPLEDDLDALFFLLDRPAETSWQEDDRHEAVSGFEKVRAYLLPELWCEDGVPRDCDDCDAHQGIRTCNRVQEFNPHAWCDGSDVEDRAVTVATTGGVL